MKRIKNITILVLTVLLSANIYCQTAYLTLAGSDLGVGLRLDKQFKSTGVYGSVSYGNYKLYNGGYINDHYKVSGGMLLLFPEGGIASVGVNYHHYGSYDVEYINGNVLTPLSLEVGFGREIGRFTPALRLDPIKWEVSVDFGFNFGEPR
jgi:hypothetical protein